MANVYGSRDKNQFLLPSVESGEKYYTLVNPDNGEITLKRISFGSFTEGLDATVGTIAATGPNKGKFIPGNGASETEKKAFAQQPQALRQVKDKAIETSNNAQRKIATDQGIPVDEPTLAKRTNEIFGEEGRASTSLNPDVTGGTEATNESVSLGRDLLNNSLIESSGITRLVTQYPTESLLKYPIDMDTKQDCMKFTMLEYRPRKLGPDLISGGKAFGDRPKTTVSTRGSTVVLPIQPSITDANTVKWGEDQINSLEAIAAATALSTINEGEAGAIQSITGMSKLIAGNNASLGNLAAAFFAQQAAGVKGLVPRVLGGILNPNIELLFEGPQLRTFQFNIVLSSREENESRNIRNIIRFFKQGMSVKRAKTDLFLKAPHTFEIKYIYGITQQEHPWINKIKECALTGCTVNYTPAGSYATFGDGAMTSYEIGLQFSELEAIYDDDYAEADKAIGGGLDSSIGY